MKTVLLPSGEHLPALGIGTWRMGERPASRDAEVATIRLALDSGATLIDTAEMYGEGAAEELIGAALERRRDSAFIVSKVYPHNATRTGTIAACDRSLRRLRTDRIDLYLLHWLGSTPLAETLEAFMNLQKGGKIRHYGVSNLDLKEMQQAWAVPGGQAIATDQLLYNLTRRGIELDLLPWLRERRVPTMAYSPIEQGRVLNNSRLTEFAHNHCMTPAQAALGWLLAKPDIIVIPKASRPEHFKENLAALATPLTRDQISELDRLFPAPDAPQPLAML